MQAVKISILMVLVPYSVLIINAHADVIELSAEVMAGRFAEGVNLTDDDLSAGLAAEWSANNGVFSSLACFIGENRGQSAIQRGCDASLGWFTPISDDHALTLAVSRHDYSSPVLSGWEYTDVSLNWHMGKNYTLELKTSDSLLGQGFRSVASTLHAVQPLNDNWRMRFEVGLIDLENTAPVSSLGYGLASVQYNRGRWVAELTTMVSDSGYQRFVNLDSDQPDISLSLRYRLY